MNVAAKRITTSELCLIGVGTAMIAVLSPLTLPLPGGVPMTLQTLMVMLAGVALGAKKGTIAAAIYVLLGAIGLPVFAGFSGGFGILLGPTGGFLLSFPLMAWCAGIGVKRKTGLFLGLICGTLLNYFCGMVWYAVVAQTTLVVAFWVCVAPFLVLGIVKIVLAAVLGMPCRHVLARMHLQHVK